MNYTDLVNDIETLSTYVSDGYTKAVLRRAADAIEALQRNLNDCRNELCLYCGQYKQRHKGACDGCRWMPKEETE